MGILREKKAKKKLWLRPKTKQEIPRKQKSI